MGRTSYSAAVTPVEYPGGWRVHIEIRDAAGILVERRQVDGFVFEKRQEAVDAGWRIAESLIRESTPGDSDDPGRPPTREGTGESPTAPR
jgi:hypothetical protein